MPLGMIAAPDAMPGAESGDWREQWIAPEIMICLAGRAAEARARRPDRDGWRRSPDDPERVAIHDAGHVVVAVAVGRFQNGAAIEEVVEGYRGIAQDFRSAPSELVPDCPSFENFNKLKPDFRRATDYAKLAIGSRGWLRYLRDLWLRVDGILTAHWLATRVLAMELRANGVVRRHRAQKILDQWWYVPQGSMSEALARRGAVVRHVRLNMVD